MRPVKARYVLAPLVLASLGACVDRPAEDPPPRPLSPRRVSVRSAIVDAGVEAEPVHAEPTPPEPPPAPPRDLKGKVILHAGDSMVGGNGGLAKGLSAYFKGEGAKFYRDAEVAVSIRKYAQAPRFRRLLDHFKPDIVILTLGANDVFLPYPDYYASYVEGVVKAVGERECWWIGPPTWKPDTGIVEVIRQHAGKCKFFDSSHLDIARAKDRIHPNDEGGAEWANQFWAFFRGKPAPVHTKPEPDDDTDDRTLKRGGTVRIGGGAPL